MKLSARTDITLRVAQVESHMGAFLLLVIDELVDKRGMVRADLGRKEGGTGLSEAALSRLWAGEATTPRKGWDDFVAGAGEVLGVEPIQIWTSALRYWKRDPTGEIPKSLRRVAATAPPQARGPKWRLPKP